MIDAIAEGQGKPIPILLDVQLVDSGWINKYRLTYLMPNGARYQYESVSRKNPEAYRRELERNAAGEAPTPDAVCIVPLLEESSVLLIREFRYPLNSWCIAFPAGLIEPGENLADAVDRELREETGYRLRGKTDPKLEAIDADAQESLALLPQTGYSSTGMAEENVQVVFAQVEPDGEAQPEESEFIEIFLLERSQIRSFLDTNTTPIGTRCQLILEMLSRMKDA